MINELLVANSRMNPLCTSCSLFTCYTVFHDANDLQETPCLRPAFSSLTWKLLCLCSPVSFQRKLISTRTFPKSTGTRGNTGTGQSDSAKIRCGRVIGHSLTFKMSDWWRFSETLNAKQAGRSANVKTATKNKM